MRGGSTNTILISPSTFLLVGRSCCSMIFINKAADRGSPLSARSTARQGVDVCGAARRICGRGADDAGAGVRSAAGGAAA